MKYKLLAACLTLAAVSTAQAAPLGQLDTKFSTDGMAIAAFDVGGNLHDRVAAQLAGPGGSTYVVGQIPVDDNTDSLIMGVAKFQHDGKLDLTYGDGGRAMFVVPHGELLRSPTGLAMTASGSLLVTATVRSQNKATGIVCRLTNIGALDASFGERKTPGCKRVGLASMGGNILSGANAVVVRADGSVLVGGNFLTAQGVGAAGIAALSENGHSIVESFGSGGFVFFSGMSRVPMMQQSPDQALIAVVEDTNPDPALASNNLAKVDLATGQLRTNFGEEGIAKIELDTTENVLPGIDGLDVAKNGAISIVGHVGELGVEFRSFVAKFGASGTLNPAFGNAGLIEFEHSSTRYRSLADVVSIGNDIVVVGGVETGPNLRQWNAIRLNSQGNVVASFGDGGGTNLPLRWDAAKIDLQGSRMVMSGTSTGAQDDAVSLDFNAARLDHGLSSSFPVFPQAGANGTIQPATQVNVGHSDIAEFKISPKPGFRIASVTGCGNGERIGSRYRTAPVTGACVINATFEKIPFIP